MTILLKLKADYKNLTGKDPPSSSSSQAKKKDKTGKEEAKKDGESLYLKISVLSGNVDLRCSYN